MKKRDQGIGTILPALALTAVIGLAGGFVALAADVDEPVAENSAPTQMNRSGGGCQCGGPGARAEEAGAGCRGRMGQSGPRGMSDGEGRGRGGGMRRGMGPGADGPGACRGGRNRDAMQSIHALVHEYRADIVREIEDVVDGVSTVTRAPGNPEAVEALQRHVGEMKDLLANGGRIRAWDPLFSEIFDRADEIAMSIEMLEDGVRVTETSQDPEVVGLIRTHARKVSDFVARGPAAVHEPTPLPSGYRPGE